MKNLDIYVLNPSFKPMIHYMIERKGEVITFETHSELREFAEQELSDYFYEAFRECEDSVSWDDYMDNLDWHEEALEANGWSVFPVIRRAS